jgi:predicted RNA binding protein YcfA (HicA-like mRNA interferase family)
MTKKKKLIEKFQNSRGEVNLEEVRKILRIIGYDLVRIRGSHHMFRNKNEDGITIAVHNGKITKAYAKVVKNIIKDKNGKI